MDTFKSPVNIDCSGFMDREENLLIQGLQADRQWCEFDAIPEQPVNFDVQDWIL